MDIDLMDIDQQAMGIHFQEEVIMEILSWLPVRPLLRFKCVSKLWKTLISDPYFKMKHLNHAKNNQNSQKFLISQRRIKNGLFSLYCCPLSSVQRGEDLQKLDCPSSPKPRHCAIRCCYDGLVLIHVTDSIDIERSSFLLWNPSTRESIVLPDPEFPEEDFCFGLGYDSTCGDYKILKIRTDIGGCTLPNEVLALKSGSWRKIDKRPHGVSFLSCDMHHLALVNEAFHWIGVSRNYSVVSFSISNEAYGEIPFPEQISHLRGKIAVGVSVLEGMLCAYFTYLCRRKDTFKLWVLKDYGLKESWNALFTIDDHWIVEVIPKYRFADGGVLYWAIHLQHEGHTFWTSKRQFGLWRQCLWPQCDAFQNGIAFTESLISPRSLI